MKPRNRSPVHGTILHGESRRRSEPRTMVVGVSAALSTALLGLALLGAASLGHFGLLVPGFALLAVGGAMAAALRWRNKRRDLDRPSLADLATAHQRLEECDYASAASAALKAAAGARTSSTRNEALTALAWAALRQGYSERAKAALDRIDPSHAVDMCCLAAVESARGNPDRAIGALEVARTAGSLTCDGAKLLVDCCASRCGIERAVLAALQTRDALGAENCNMVVKAACDAGAYAAAATLAAAIGSDAGLSRAIVGAR
jgi:hypothetical protein